MFCVFGINSYVFAWHKSKNWPRPWKTKQTVYSPIPPRQIRFGISLFSDGLALDFVYIRPFFLQASIRRRVFSAIPAGQFQFSICIFCLPFWFLVYLIRGFDNFCKGPSGAARSFRRVHALNVKAVQCVVRKEFNASSRAMNLKETGATSTLGRAQGRYLPLLLQMFMFYIFITYMVRNCFGQKHVSNTFGKN